MEKHYAFREKLCQVHKPNRINEAVWKNIDGTVIDSSWTIRKPCNAGIILSNAVKDLQQYFAVSMRLNLAISCEAGEKQIVFKTSLEADKPSYRITVDDTIVIDGTNEKMTAQGVFALEDQMNLNEGPVVKTQDQVFTPMFSPRVIHTGLGGDLRFRANMYPDEHLNMIAHTGMDAIMVGTGNVIEDEEYRACTNDIIDRALNYGIESYTFAHFKNRRHPSEPDAWEHYDSMYGELFRCCPNLKGIFIVGETCEFPSHDARTTGKTWRESINDDKPSPGWFPCDDYPEFVTMLRDVVHKQKPDAEVIFWTYNWGYIDTDLRVKLIESMPEGITLMSTYEMFEEFDIKPGVKEYCSDYTLFFTGPGKYFSSEVEAAAKRGINYMTMCNTGGNTWDIGVVPYLPAPGQWFKRYAGLVDAHKKYTLNALLESHTYGFWPSFLPELAKAAYTEPQQDMNALLRAIAVRDYGEVNADTVLSAWEHFSEGMRHCISTNEDQYGPCRIGPAYPLFFEKSEKIPVGPESFKNPNNTCDPVYRFNPDNMDKLAYEIDEYSLMMNEFRAGNELLASIIPTLPENKKPYAEEALTVSRFIENTARTTVNVKRWHKAKIHIGVYVDSRAIWTGGRHDMADAKSPVKPLDIREDREYWINELIAIGEAEIRNAEDTIPLVQANSRLGYTQELDYCGSEEQILWKIEKTRAAIEEEVKPLLKK
ncbi:MAG: hypothetical protein E7463_11835 [Ruminococcaceae bacterium]|nr:hypothetical protein [Oscillospiraceae bacterium]